MYLRGSLSLGFTFILTLRKFHAIGTLRDPTHACLLSLKARNAGFVFDPLTAVDHVDDI